MGRFLPDTSSAVAGRCRIASTQASLTGFDSSRMPNTVVIFNPMEKTMSNISTLSDLYIDELKDLWSANDQMSRALTKITPKATNSKLKQMLESSLTGIAGHTEMLKTLIANQNEKVSKEHCKGMEGLVNEAVKHTIDDAPSKGPVLDAAIIAQYQRMTHYGITGFGTVAAFSKALKLESDNQQLKGAVRDMYAADQLMTELAEAAVNEDAADE